MKIVALEEHFLPSLLREAWSELDPTFRDPVAETLGTPELKARLEDFTELRIKQMDESGVDVQVLSPSAPGVQNFGAKKSVEVAQQINDFVAGVVQQEPTRFDAFATLATPDPEEAARELERTVTQLGFKGAMLQGRTRSRYLDHPDFTPIFETAAKLGVPLYIHPQTPLPIVRETLYYGFEEKLDISFASSGWGWHLETGIQAVRLILSGIFDRYPDLQIILGHWGENMIFYLERINELSKFAKHLKKPVANYVHENFYITPSGIFSPNYLKWSLDVVSAERLMFSTDYPYRIEPGRGARDFIEKSGLDNTTKELISSGNWEKLTAKIKSS